MPSATPLRTPWKELITRVFLVDPTPCRCGGTFRPVAVIRSRDQCRRYLEGVGRAVRSQNVLGNGGRREERARCRGERRGRLVGRPRRAKGLTGIR